MKYVAQTITATALQIVCRLACVVLHAQVLGARCYTPIQETVDTAAQFVQRAGTQFNLRIWGLQGLQPAACSPCSLRSRRAARLSEGWGRTHVEERVTDQITLLP